CHQCLRGDEALYRCEECVGTCLYCAACTVEAHAHMPLHWIKRWNGKAFERVSLRNLGLRVQLLHAAGDVCQNRHEDQDANFIVLHTNGIHCVHVDFCSCEQRGGRKPDGSKLDRPTQLLDMRLFPATVHVPHTAATFAVLDDFHVKTNLGNICATKYYQSLIQATDGAGVQHLPDRRTQWQVMVRAWRCLMTLKHRGALHDVRSVDELPDGELAARCPACPHLVVARLATWLTDDGHRPSDPSARLFLCCDACFRLSNRANKATDETDPSVLAGLAYGVRERDYQAFAKHVFTTERDKDQEPSTCSNFDAMGLANQKGGKHLRSTGITGIFCQRHEFWQANGHARLHKGEKYFTTDYLLVSVMRHFMWLQLLVIAYDIACQWSKNLKDRLCRILRGFVIAPRAATFVAQVLPKTVFVVPKFHLAAHKDSCQSSFNLTFTPGVGLTDGEASERAWSGINPVAASMKEMGPGSARDTMEDRCGFWNWRKHCGIARADEKPTGRLLASRLTQAIADGEEQCDVFTEFSQSVKDVSAGDLAKWIEKIERWEKTHEGENPYEARRYDVCGGDRNCESVRKRPEARGREVHTRGVAPSTQEDTDCHYLSRLRMWRVRRRAHKTSDRERSSGRVTEQDIRAVQRDNELWRRNTRYRSEVQATAPDLFGAIPPCDQVIEEGEDRRPEDELQYFPSDLPPDTRRTIRPFLVEIEADIRHAAMAKDLDDLKGHLRLRSCLNRFKRDNVSGQHANTRARAAQNTVQVLIDDAGNRYLRSREAYMALVGDGEWTRRFRELRPEDKAGLNERGVLEAEENSLMAAREFTASQRGVASGETRHKVSWIWRTGASGKDGLTDDLRLEWFKARSRARRHHEEVVLLLEEMDRILAFCDWEASRWQERGSARSVDDPDLREGLSAGAFKMAATYNAQKTAFAEQCKASRVLAASFLHRYSHEGYATQDLGGCDL
ncbi:hypothetical protein K488DRAFT_61873, partial [Vararia minispora EC-137]